MKTRTITMPNCNSTRISVKKLEWTESGDGYIICDLGFIKWEIHLGCCEIWLNQLILWHQHDTVEGAKTMVENRMREFILSRLGVEE